jgi:hypothetical protein
LTPLHVNSYFYELIYIFLYLSGGCELACRGLRGFAGNHFGPNHNIDDIDDDDWSPLYKNPRCRFDGGIPYEAGEASNSCIRFSRLHEAGRLPLCVSMSAEVITTMQCSNRDRMGLRDIAYAEVIKKNALIHYSGVVGVIFKE